MTPCVRKSGAEGIRTPDPLTASQMRYQLRHSPLLERRYTSTCRRPHQGPAQPAAIAFFSQLASLRSIFLPLTAMVGVPKPPLVCRAVSAAALAVSAVTAFAFFALVTQPAKSAWGLRSVPSAMSWASVRPALPSAGCDSNSFAW